MRAVTGPGQQANVARSDSTSSWRSGIFPRLLAAFLLVSMLPLGVYWGLQSSQLAAAERARAESHLLMFSRRLVQQVDDWTGLHLRMLRTAAALPGLRSMAAEEQQPIVDSLAQNLPWSYLIHTLNAEGMNVARSDGRAPRSYAFRKYFSEVMTGAPYFAEAQIGVTSRRPAFLMSVPITGPAGQVQGALAAAATLNEVAQAVTAARVGSTGIAFLTTAQGKLLAHPEEPLGQDLLDYSDHPALQAAAQQPGQIVAFRYGGRERLAVAGRTALGWIAVVQQDADESLAGVRRANRTGVLLLGATTFAVLLLSLLVAQGFARPLERVTQVANRIARGDLSHFAPSDRRDQIGDLERAMAAMAAALTDSIEEIDRQRTLLGATLENLPQGISVVDTELRLLSWNRRYLEIFEFPPGLVRHGVPIADLMRSNAERDMLGDGDVDAEIDRRLKYLASGSPHHHERRLPDGTTLEIRGSPVPDIGYVTVFSDVSNYKRTEQELRSLTNTLERRVRKRTAALEAASAEARRANQAKSRFLAAAVHDLTQPISAARMYVSLLKRQLLGQPGSQLAESADSALGSIERVFSDLMDLARFERGQLKPVSVDLPVTELFDTLEREYSELARRRGLRLDFRAAGAVVHSDRNLLYRIVQNFLSNALRYTPSGRVLVGVRRRGARRRITVWDTGPGIPEHRQEEIFDEFRRLNTQAADGEHGTGLGLAIVRNIAAALNHQVGLRSIPGRGSEFWVELPAGKEPEATASTSAAAAEGTQLSGLTAWCVDDHAGVRSSTEAALAAWNCTVRGFGSTAPVLAAARQEPPPDLLLLDYLIDERDGLTLLAELDEIWPHPVPALLITGEQDPALRRQQRAPVLHKPLEADALLAAISNLIGRSAG